MTTYGYEKGVTAAVIGLGYVGLPLALDMAKAGHKVIGIDISAERVQTLLDGQSYIVDVPSEMVRAMIERGNFLPVTSFERLPEADVISICVPTPLRKTKDPDLSFVSAASEEVGRYIRTGQVVVLESTTYPGTTEELVLPMLERGGLKVGTDFFLAFSPERVDPGNATFSTHNTPKVFGGITNRCSEHAVAFYSTFLDSVVPVSSARVAEMVKLLENTFRAVNIAMVNEMAMLCDRMQIDIWEVISAASTKPFGFMPFFPGPGIGGHCIPLDPLYLSWKAKTFDFFHRFIELASEVNASMPRFVMSKVSELLNTAGLAVKGSNVLLLGLSYKRDIDDLRESPALEIYEFLCSRGANVVCSDPYVSSFLNGEGAPILTQPLTTELVHDADLVLLITDHSAFDYKMIADNARLVFDTRNAFKDYTYPTIHRLGTGTPLQTNLAGREQA